MTSCRDLDRRLARLEAQVESLAAALEERRDDHEAEVAETLRAALSDLRAPRGRIVSVDRNHIEAGHA